MKAQQPVTNLNRKTLRAIERDLGVYLDTPRTPCRTSRQQYGVYDEDEVHVADITASERYFTEEELREKVTAAFRTAVTATQQRGL